MVNLVEKLSDRRSAEMGAHSIGTLSEDRPRLFADSSTGMDSIPSL
jgi:hypothetical protein